MDENTKNIITLCISGYAAVISTITLIWNIVNKMSRIKVRADFYTTMAFNDLEMEQGPGLLQITILNKSKRIKYVKVPQIKLSYNHGWDLTEKDKNKNIINLYLTGNKLTFPIEMKPESEIILKYPLGKSSEWMYKKAKENDTFKIIITDTTEKKYKSSKLKIKRLKDCIEHNLTINCDLISQVIKNN